MRSWCAASGRVEPAPASVLWARRKGAGPGACRLVKSELNRRKMASFEGSIDNELTTEQVERYIYLARIFPHVPKTLLVGFAKTNHSLDGALNKACEHCTNEINETTNVKFLPLIYDCV